MLPHSSTPAILVSSEGAILRETLLRMRLWTKRIRLTRAARPQRGP